MYVETTTPMDRVLDALYARDDVAWRGQVCVAAELCDVTDELIGYVARLPERPYTRGELTDAVNGLIDEDGRGAEVGHLH